MKATDIFNAHMVISRMLDPSSRTFEPCEAAWLITAIPAQSSTGEVLEYRREERTYYDVPAEDDILDMKFPDHQKIARYRVYHAPGSMEIVACAREGADVQGEYCLLYDRAGQPSSLKRFRSLHWTFNRRTQKDDTVTITRQRLSFGFWFGWKRPAAKEPAYSALSI